MKNHSEKKEINRIEKRAIEALAIAPVIKAVGRVGNAGKIDGANPSHCRRCPPFRFVS
ncbi:hypothetical protein QUF75_18315 [Desulfococcaceae bacterium HSG7]|nr:hypothetical protein [Desulfococcaceae bacterium HSG7]